MRVAESPAVIGGRNYNMFTLPANNYAVVTIRLCRFNGHLRGIRETRLIFHGIDRVRKQIRAKRGNLIENMRSSDIIQGNRNRKTAGAMEKVLGRKGNVAFAVPEPASISSSPPPVRLCV